MSTKPGGERVEPPGPPSELGTSRQGHQKPTATDFRHEAHEVPHGVNGIWASDPDAAGPRQHGSNHSINTGRESVADAHDAASGFHFPEAQREAALSDHLLDHFIGDVFVTFRQRAKDRADGPDGQAQPNEQPSKHILRQFVEDIVGTFTRRKDAASVRPDSEQGNAQPGNHPGKHLVIYLAELQRMRLVKLLANITQRVMIMRFENREPADWEDLLKEYTSAVRDYDFMLSCEGRSVDPFIVTSLGHLQARILRFELRNVPEAQRRGAAGEDWDHVNFAKPKIQDEPTRREYNQELQFKAFARRLAMAVGGGLFLIAPMWLMVLKQDLYVALGSTTGFVLVFALTMAWLLKTEAIVMVMTSTAAYAAVLVVFVGTTSGPTGVPR